MTNTDTSSVILRAVNLVGGAFERGGGARRWLDADVLMNKASRAEGLFDFGSSDFEEGLHVLLDSLETDAHLSTVGRFLARSTILSALQTRLLWVDQRRSDPARFTAPIPSPIIIVGLPRTGSTMLQKLMAAMPEADALRLWETSAPLASAGVDRRRVHIGRQLSVARKLRPALDRKHHLAVDGVEECVALLNPSFRSDLFWMLMPVRSYARWLQAQDQSDAFALYGELVRSLARSRGQKHLVLKCPMYTSSIPELLGAFPSAHIVQTHRDPEKVVASAFSLKRTIHGVFSDSWDTEANVETGLDLFSSMVKRADDIRRAGLAPSAQDVHYDDLMADPISVVRRLYSGFGLPWPEGAEAALIAHMETHTQSRHGVHRYALSDVGLTPRDVEEALGDYWRRYEGA